MPYGTDVFEAESITAGAGKFAWGKGAKAVILPTIPFGVNIGQSNIYLDINMNPSTQLAILKDILTVLDRQGVKGFLILNSHGGNDFKTMLRELGLLFPDMLLVCRKFKFLYWLSAARCRIVELEGSLGGLSSLYPLLWYHYGITLLLLWYGFAGALLYLKRKERLDNILNSNAIQLIE